MPTMPGVLLFDLGGVLVEFSGVPDVAPLLRTAATASEIAVRWRRCPHTEAFCRGALSREAFAERFVRDWGIDVPPDRFLQAFRAWSKRLLPGAEALLASLRPRFRLAGRDHVLRRRACQCRGRVAAGHARVPGRRGGRCSRTTDARAPAVRRALAAIMR